jgi:hypothetical protein
MERKIRADSNFKRRNYDVPHDQEHRRRQSERLEESFADSRLKGERSRIRQILRTWLEDIDQDILTNTQGGFRWIRPYLLPPLPTAASLFGFGAPQQQQGRRPRPDDFETKVFFAVDRESTRMAWQDEWDALSTEEKTRGPPVDYTPREKYHYPELQMEPPESGGYPQLRSLEELMHNWNQDEDHEGIIPESLIHFNYSNPEELQAAKLFRDAELPFKLYDIPEITNAGNKWTDDYLSENFASGDNRPHFLSKAGKALASGMCQESVNNYFAFFVPKMWNIDSMGLAPTRTNDWNFQVWADHARYADATVLSPDRPHFYWQAGVGPNERFNEPKHWTFITKDLPSFSATEENFFLFRPKEQKGIQCRFGERGVAAATHFDGGRNMVAMMNGAKRYILSPPKQCSRLGTFTNKKSPIYRHSLLNFGHLTHLDDITKSEGMSLEERAWLERASSAQAVETVLKGGEVLYIPSHWFHYIISVQKSAQCNVRSGIDNVGTEEFGGSGDVDRCTD